jgi:hypothetical protein
MSLVAESLCFAACVADVLCELSPPRVALNAAGGCEWRCRRRGNDALPHCGQCCCTSYHLRADPVPVTQCPPTRTLLLLCTRAPADSRITCSSTAMTRLALRCLTPVAVLCLGGTGAEGAASSRVCHQLPQRCRGGVSVQRPRVGSSPPRLAAGRQLGPRCLRRC